MTPDQLVEGYLDRVYALCLRLTGNSPDASDLAQDVMLKAIAGLPGFRGDADAGTWLFRIAVNAWKNRVASAPERWRKSLAPLDGFLDVPAGESPPDREMENREEAVALERALAGVAPEDRAALVLRELEDKSYEEIAGILGVPVGTVKSRLHRARAALAESWERDHAA